MESDPEKGIICVEVSIALSVMTLLQLMNSMAVSDTVLSIICSDEFTNRCKSVIDMNFGTEATAKSIKDKSLALNDRDADLNRAIQLSLEQSKKEKASHYPSVPAILNTATPTKNISGKVLFSFKAEEPGELTIRAGDIVTIIDQWYPMIQLIQQFIVGSFEGKTGLFPSNFVTFDLSAPITEIPTPENVQIDEKTLEICLSKLLNANPVGPDDAEGELMENSREMNITSYEPQAQHFANTHAQYPGDLNDENLPIYGGDQYYQNPPQQQQFFSAQNSHFQPPFTGEHYSQNAQQQYGYPYYQYPPTDQPPSFISGSTHIPNYSQKKQ
ncbi:LOW QUALITY PROTEIN: hypothetical protein MXB_2531 [Myxobolus squamalis]|nr:LOW QUALITY PROTEIN: hypothetical protein MXB_2531 [Myxobolus squamalis]